LTKRLGPDWLHEIKYDSYRMHARLDRGKVQLLTRTGLDWSNRYRFTIEALRSTPRACATLLSSSTISSTPMPATASIATRTATN
jgi:ATP-dependent DNA ligase